jgi:maltooligosyltrehalose trehalohydrolase
LWIEVYRLDGLRLDAINSIYDFGPRHILRAVKETADDSAGPGRRVQVIGESDLNDIRLVLPPERGGYGLDGQWNDDFHHMVHAYLTNERQGYYADFGQVQDLPKLLEKTFVLDGVYSKYRDRRHGAPAGDLAGDRFVVSIQNHDQVGNRAHGERLHQLISPQMQRLSASLMLLSPYLPLLFMGEEYAEPHPFLFFCSFGDGRLIKSVREGRRREFAAFRWQSEPPDPQAEATLARSRLTWSWPEGSIHAGMRSLYRDLLAARRFWPALRDFRQRAAGLFPDEERPAILYLVRGGQVPEADRTLQVYFNLTDQPQPLPPLNPPDEEMLFSSEAGWYQGQRGPGDSPRQLLPHECVVWGPRSWAKGGREGILIPQR